MGRMSTQRSRSAWSLADANGGAMIAILSDIHGNFDAMEAVLADADTFGVESIYCLGDLVGFGPDPIACLQAAMTWNIVLMGDFDAALMDFEKTQDWLKTGEAGISLDRLRHDLARHPEGERLRAFLKSRPLQQIEGVTYYVHGSPRDPLAGWVFPEDVYLPHKLDSTAELFQDTCFCGHTHIPGIFCRSLEGVWTYHAPPEVDNLWRLDDRKIFCNVGSVGQPRDGDPRACYVLYATDSITFRRVGYNHEATFAKLRDLGDHGSAARLLEGK